MSDSDSELAAFQHPSSLASTAVPLASTSVATPLADRAGEVARVWQAAVGVALNDLELLNAQIAATLTAARIVDGAAAHQENRQVALPRCWCATDVMS